MIRRFSPLILLVLAVVMLTAAGVSAQQPPLTNEHLQRIKDNCQLAGGTLRQLHASDALLRVNRGQLYDLLSTKLMARMNSRLAANKLDASKLVDITASFDKSLNDFRSQYQMYEEQLAATIKIDCQQKPAEFYDAVRESRERRARVNDAVQSLARYINDYSHEFDTFRASFQQNHSEGKSS